MHTVSLRLRPHNRRSLPPPRCTLGHLARGAKMRARARGLRGRDILGVVLARYFGAAACGRGLARHLWRLRNLWWIGGHNVFSYREDSRSRMMKLWKLSRAYAWAGQYPGVYSHRLRCWQAASRGGKQLVVVGFILLPSGRR